MTDEQRKLLEAMHTIKDYCTYHSCDKCCFAKPDSSDCAFIASGETPNHWGLKPLETDEKNWSVFKVE